MRSWKRRFTVMFLLAVWTTVVAASATTLSGRYAHQQSFSQHVYDIQSVDGAEFRPVTTVPPLAVLSPPVANVRPPAIACESSVAEIACRNSDREACEVDNQTLTEILRVRKSLRSEQTDGSTSDACSEQEFADALRQVMTEPRLTVAYDEPPAASASATIPSLVVPQYSSAPAPGWGDPPRSEPPHSEPPRSEPPRSGSPYGQPSVAEPAVAKSVPPSMYPSPYGAPAATNYTPSDSNHYDAVPVPLSPYSVQPQPHPYAPPPKLYPPSQSSAELPPNAHQWCETATVNTRSDVVVALRRVGRQLDLLAADMDDQRQFEDAESLRQLVRVVRAEARRIEEAKGSDGSGESAIRTYAYPMPVPLP